MQYVEGVLKGEKAPDNAVGRKLLDLVNSVPKMSPDEFEKMVNSNMKVSGFDGFAFFRHSIQPPGLKGHHLLIRHAGSSQLTKAVSYVNGDMIASMKKSRTVNILNMNDRKSDIQIPEVL